MTQIKLCLVQGFTQVDTTWNDFLWWLWWFVLSRGLVELFVFCSGPLTIDLPPRGEAPMVVEPLHTGKKDSHMVEKATLGIAKLSVCH